MSDIDAAVIMAQHEGHHDNLLGHCCGCIAHRDSPPCLPYRLAAENARLAAQVEAVRALADKWEHGALRWTTNPLPVPPEVALIRAALATEGAEQ